MGIMTTLTNREREIVTLLASGVRQSTIARQLCISRHTVYNHVANARRKTGEASAFALAVKAAVEAQSPQR